MGLYLSKKKAVNIQFGLLPFAKTQILPLSSHKTLAILLLVDILNLRTTNLAKVRKRKEGLEKYN